MTKPRTIVPVSLQFAVRYTLRSGLLRRMAEYAQPVVLLAWDDPELQKEFESVGAEVHRLPHARWGLAYMRIRDVVSAWHARRLQSPSTAIDERRNLQDMPGLERAYRRTRLRATQAAMLLPGMLGLIRRNEQELFWSDTNAPEVDRLIADLRPDAVVSACPYNRDEELFVRACALRRLPLCASILSFDNLITRGWISVTFDRYLLWNRHMEAELRRVYVEAARSPAIIVGAPQFDFYYDPSYIWDEPFWRKRLNLPADRPVILFGGGFKRLVPNQPDWLRQLDEAIERGEIPDDPIILFRRHPNDPVERWQAVLARARHVVYDDPWPGGKEMLGRTDVRREDIEKLASTLAHSHVQLNAASTLTVDGSIFNRPQIGPAYDDSPGRRYDRTVRELYLREHYLPIMRAGGLDVAYSRDELVTAIRRGLEEPERLAQGRRRIAQEICTFTDGKATERVDRELRAFLAQSAGRPGCGAAGMPA